MDGRWDIGGVGAGSELADVVRVVDVRRLILGSAQVPQASPALEGRTFSLSTFFFCEEKESRPPEASDRAEVLPSASGANANPFGCGHMATLCNLCLEAGQVWGW